MGDAGIKSAIQGSNVPNPDEAVPSFVSGAMAKAGKGLLEGTLQAGTSAVSDKLLDLVGLGGKSAADKGKDTRDYLAAAFPELNAWERAGADASSAGIAFKKVISRRNIRRRITIPLTLSNLKLLRRITRTENILHRNFTRRQVAIQNRVASNIGISQSTFSVKVLNLFSRSRRKT